LEHATKLVERIFKHRIWQQIDIDEMQFGTSDAIFIVRQMQEKFRAKGKKLCFGFVDFEKTFDKVSREVIRWAMLTHWELKNGYNQQHKTHVLCYKFESGN